MVTEDEVRDALRKVIDPEIGLDVVALGLIYTVNIEEKAVNIDMTLTTPACPVGPQMMAQAQAVVEDAFPDIDEANINLVFSPFWDPSMMSEEAKDELGMFG